MTNEELVISIQQGNTDLTPQFWQQVERFVQWKAYERIREIGNDRVVRKSKELCGAGYIAFSKAIQTYKPDKGNSFLSWLGFYLKNAFREATGYLTRRQQNDPIRAAISLDTPVRDSDDGKCTIGDLVASEDNIEETVVGSVWQKELHAALVDALETLDKRQAEILRLEFFERKTFQQIGAALGASAQTVKADRTKAILSLRGNTAVMQRLYPFYYGKQRKAPVVQTAICAEALAARRNSLLSKPLV